MSGSNVSPGIARCMFCSVLEYLLQQTSLRRVVIRALQYMSRTRCRVSLWEGTDLTEREHEETHWHEDADGPWKVVLFRIKCVRAPGPVRQDR